MISVAAPWRGASLLYVQVLSRVETVVAETVAVVPNEGPVAAVRLWLLDASQ
jgi:hypothetical protein